MYEYIQPLGSRAFIGRLRPYNYPRDRCYNGWIRQNPRTVMGIRSGDHRSQSRSLIHCATVTVRKSKGWWCDFERSIVLTGRIFGAGIFDVDL